MKITEKHVFLAVAVISAVAFAGLLVWKFVFSGNIPKESLIVLGIIVIAVFSCYIALFSRH